jgi:hypothetical protein
MAALPMEVMLAEDRLDDEFDQVRGAWWDLNVAVGLALEGRGGRHEIDAAERKLAAAEARARAEIAASLELLRGVE